GNLPGSSLAVPRRGRMSVTTEVNVCPTDIHLQTERDHARETGFSSRCPGAGRRVVRARARFLGACVGQTSVLPGLSPWSLRRVENPSRYHVLRGMSPEERFLRLLNWLRGGLPRTGLEPVQRPLRSLSRLRSGAPAGKVD